MKKLVVVFLSLVVMSCGSKSKLEPVSISDEYASKVDSVLALMTLDEKIGQLIQYTGSFDVTGPAITDTTKITQIKAGLVGSMLNIKGAEDTRELQNYAMQSRLKIPLIFGLDVIHGLRTVYPIPLGEAASFDLDLMRRTAAGAAKEATAEGIHWTFAPMVDIGRDARWGRVMEGAGEDTWFGVQVAKARIHGFQGDKLSDVHTLMACAKHFAAYGACIGGKDYNSADMSDVTLHNVYLPPFKAAVEVGVGSFMNAFNDLNGIPATANVYLLRDLLKGQWGFSGLVVSDWNSVSEIATHGYAVNKKRAGLDAITAGCDMDMESRVYKDYLKELVTEGLVSEKYIDDAVRRILLKKFELGLFDDPYRYCSPEREKSIVLSPELRALSREAGMKSIVLLKNDSQALPVNQDIRSIAVIGALADSKKDMLGNWANDGVDSVAITLLAGLKNKYPKAIIQYVEGYNLETNELTSLNEAKAIAAKSDVVIVAVGERYNQSGEAKSLSDISVAQNQQQLVKELRSMNKRLVAVVMGGRPLIFNDVRSSADAILFTWWLGTEAGNAMADVIAGDYNPSAKLPMTFPAHNGQIPMYYNTNNTGRPESPNSTWTSRYIDIDSKPAYPFGFGMSYTSFEISAPIVAKKGFALAETIQVRVKVANTGRLKGKETVQLYIRDLNASVVRPIKELKGMQQVELSVGESRELVLELTAQELGFFNTELKFITEPGEFEIMVGANSNDLKKVKIRLK